MIEANERVRLSLSNAKSDGEATLARATSDVFILNYDFPPQISVQAVGACILVKNDLAGDENPFQAQVRFEPLTGSDRVSGATRMAVNVGDTVVEIDALGDEPLPIDRVVLAAEQTARGAADADGDGIADIFFGVDFSDFIFVLNSLTEQLKVKNMDGVLNACVFLSDDRVGGHADGVQGLVGNANGDASDDLMLRDGSATLKDPRCQERYVTYASSLSVPTAKRLFTDDEGTGNFSDVFPVAKISIENLPPTVLAAAEAAMDAADISDPIIRESAILGFALTGDDDIEQGTLGLATDPVEKEGTTENPDMPLMISVTPRGHSCRRKRRKPENTGLYLLQARRKHGSDGWHALYGPDHRFCDRRVCHAIDWRAERRSARRR